MNWHSPPPDTSRTDRVTATSAASDPARWSAIETLRAVDRGEHACWLTVEEVRGLVDWDEPAHYGLSPDELYRLRRAYIDDTPAHLDVRSARAILGAIDAARPPPTRGDTR